MILAADDVDALLGVWFIPGIIDPFAGNPHDEDVGAEVKALGLPLFHPCKELVHVRLEAVNDTLQALPAGQIDDGFFVR